jgi:hypothetical protein
MEDLISYYAPMLKQINGRHTLIRLSSIKQSEKLQLKNLVLQIMLTEEIHIN